MKSYLYLSLLPEALVASQFAPDDYGAYLAVGSQKHARGQAMFFKIAEPFAEDRLRASGAYGLFERNHTGKPRRSCQLSVYRVLESLPLTALESLHLATAAGQVLTLRPAAYVPTTERRAHLYQEFCPVTPLVVSTQEPFAFGAHITDQSAPVNLPALVFAELPLGALAHNPDATVTAEIPAYPNLDHLRDCLRELVEKPAKVTKTVFRLPQQDVLFRDIQGGFHVAGPGGVHRYFPMPPRDQLEGELRVWWQSAQANTAS